MKNARFYYSMPTVTMKVEVVDISEVTIQDAIVNIFPKTKKATPRITICSVLNDEGNKLSFGVTLCAAQDRFEKKIGRELAYKRAIENPIQIMSVTKDTVTNIRKVGCQVIEDLVWKMNPKKF